MFNPQMMGMGMGMGNGQLPKMPTVKELWKDEKEKYRHWMILFGIGILVVFALLLTSVIMNALDEANIKDQIRNWYINDASSIPKDLDAAVNNDFTRGYIIIPSVQIALVGIGLLLFISTLIQSYQAQSFHKLSGWGTMVIGLGVFLSVYQLFSMIWSNTGGSFTTAGGLFQFITYFVIIAVYFSGSMQVSRIRRTFAQAFRIEQIKNSPEYKAMQQQMNSMQNGQMPNGFANSGPFGPTAGTFQGTPNQPNGQPNNQPNANPQTGPSKSSERIDLESMSVADLKKVASKLEISGFTTMKKTELIDAILRVTENR